MNTHSYPYNLVLIGFMGCGKSTIARALEERHHMELVEMDECIVEREGKSISRIFQEEGEEYFRNLETGLLIEMQGHTNAIISCGGGVPMRDRNVAEMKKNGRVILLTASPKTILERVSKDNTRPLLQGKKNQADIQALLDQRREKYQAAADVVISTDGKSVDAICEEIEKKLEA